MCWVMPADCTVASMLCIVRGADKHYQSALL
uniref:Uncharacterized protein n=1 Tax=Siphoviridae sp. ctL0q1 TaxID=2825449 RepID=A0A8S5PK75_9CAUD|nr:MAG TPA: hypothetical protein [Siphoviridae sp. ctL0q1]